MTLLSTADSELSQFLQQEMGPLSLHQLMS